MATRYTHKGNAPPTTLASGIDNDDLSFTVATGEGTNYPTGANGPFVIALGDRAEKVLCSSRSGDVFTVSTRGFDSTTAIAHSSPATVEHVISAAEMTQAADHIATTTHDDHTQYVHISTARTVAAAHSYTGGLSSAGSPSGYDGGEFRSSITTADSVAALSTLATGSPTLAFDHRATSNTGLWLWRNGSNAGTVRMRLLASGSLGVNLGASDPQTTIHGRGASSRLYMEDSGSGTPGTVFAWDATNTRRVAFLGRQQGSLGANIEVWTKPDSATGMTQIATFDATGKLGLGGTAVATWGLHLQGATGDKSVIGLTQTATPTSPASNSEVLVYAKGGRIIFAYNDAGTMRYKSLLLTGTGVTWVHATTAP